MAIVSDTLTITGASYNVAVNIPYTITWKQSATDHTTLHTIT